MNYSHLNTVQKKTSRGDLGVGRHVVRIDEVQDFESKNPQKINLVWAIRGTVKSSDTMAPGATFSVVYEHGPGSAGYDKATGASYGDSDIKAFLEAVVVSAGLDASATDYGKVAGGMVGPRQTAKGIEVNVRGWAFNHTNKKGESKEILKYDWSPAAAQPQFSDPLASGGESSVAAATVASSSAPPPSAPRPSAPPPAAHPNTASVRAAVVSWMQGGHDIESVRSGLGAWATDSGLSSAQFNAVIRDVFAT